MNTRNRERSDTASVSVEPGSASSCQCAHQEAPQTPHVCRRQAPIMGTACDEIVHREAL
jgi:hypothetical protein